MSQHTIDARVYYEDTDAGGIVYHASYLKFMERARTEWLRALGFSNPGLMADHNLCFVVARIDIQYKRPAKLDDLLTVGAAVEDMTATRIVMRQSVRRGEEVVADAQVTLAMIDLDSGRAAAIPDGVKALIVL